MQNVVIDTLLRFLDLISLIIIQAIEAVTVVIFSVKYNATNRHTCCSMGKHALTQGWIFHLRKVISHIVYGDLQLYVHNCQKLFEIVLDRGYQIQSINLSDII